MNMRMKTQILAPGMQNSNHPCFSLQFRKRELVDSLPETGKKQVVQLRWILHKKTVECIQNGKDHMEVWYRQ